MIMRSGSGVGFIISYARPRFLFIFAKFSAEELKFPVEKAFVKIRALLAGKVSHFSGRVYASLVLWTPNYLKLADGRADRLTKLTGELRRQYCERWPTASDNFGCSYGRTFCFR